MMANEPCCANSLEKPEELMRRLAMLVLLLIVAGGAARAQDPCSHGPSDDVAEALSKALFNAKSCSVAADLLSECRWGSSADTQFAPIVVEKCEKTFFNGLSSAGKQRYEDEMQLCAYEFARQEGTLSMSQAAMCQVDVAAEFAADPAIANRPAPNASFDCAKAQSPLEKAICSNIRLGHADIVLSRVYSGVVKNLKPAEQSTLIRNQREWLDHVSTRCRPSRPPFSDKSLNCIRNEFEIRFTDLDGCLDGEGGVDSCLWDPNAPVDEGAATDSNGAAPRASFDCESPSTALEIVICSDAELGQTDIHLAQTYRGTDAAMGPTSHKQLVESERNWLHFVSATCPLGALGGIPSVFARGCVRSAFETRIGQLQSCPNKAPLDRIPCLDSFQLFDKKSEAP